MNKVVAITRTVVHWKITTLTNSEMFWKVLKTFGRTRHVSSNFCSAYNTFYKTASSVLISLNIILLIHYTSVSKSIVTVVSYYVYIYFFLFDYHLKFNDLWQTRSRTQMSILIIKLLLPMCDRIHIIDLEYVYLTITIAPKKSGIA